MSRDERVIDRMISIGNIEDLRTDALDANDEYYAGVLLTMVRDAEAYVQDYKYSDAEAYVQDYKYSSDFLTLIGSD